MFHRDGRMRSGSKGSRGAAVLDLVYGRTSIAVRRDAPRQLARQLSPATRSNPSMKFKSRLPEKSSLDPLGGSWPPFDQLVRSLPSWTTLDIK